MDNLFSTTLITLRIQQPGHSHLTQAQHNRVAWILWCLLPCDLCFYLGHRNDQVLVPSIRPAYRENCKIQQHASCTHDSYQHLRTQRQSLDHFDKLALELKPLLRARRLAKKSTVKCHYLRTWHQHKQQTHYKHTHSDLSTPPPALAADMKSLSLPFVCGLIAASQSCRI